MGGDAMNGIGRVFVKRLHEAFDRTAGRRNVTLALMVLRGTLSREKQVDLINPALRWASDDYVLMLACDALLGTHGIESIGEVDSHKGPPIEYLNTGDTYAATLVRFRDRHRPYAVTSWGDIVENDPSYGRNQE